MGHQLIVAVLLAIDIEIDLTPLFARLAGQASVPGVVRCNRKLVGFRFIGLPGHRFEYGGESFEIGEEGFVELVADPRPRMSYERDGATLALPAGPADQFGFVDVRLAVR